MQLSALGAAMATYTSFLWENVSTDRDSVGTEWRGMKSGNYMVKFILLSPTGTKIRPTNTLCKTNSDTPNWPLLLQLLLQHNYILVLWNTAKPVKRRTNTILKLQAFIDKPVEMHSLCKLAMSLSRLPFISSGPVQRTSETVAFVLFSHIISHFARQSHSNTLPLRSLQIYAKINQKLTVCIIVHSYKHFWLF